MPISGYWNEKDFAWEGDKPTLWDYMRIVINTLAYYKGSHRRGQVYFNVLRNMKPNLAESIRGGTIDPFHIEERVDDFLFYVVRHWDDAVPAIEPPGTEFSISPLTTTWNYIKTVADQ